MAPPVTPSPHRFLAGQRRAASPNKDSRPTPVPKPQYKAAVESHAIASQPNSTQFAPTPRFGKTKPSSQRPASPPKPALAQALRASIRPAENVEDAPSQDDEEMLDNEQAYALPSTEDHDTATTWTNNLAHSPKRRRLDASDHFSSPERPTSTFKHPQTPASHFAKQVPRAPHPHQTQNSISTQQSTTATRPAFLRSSVAPPEPIEPLPDAFSPHRRGQKYAPGGMAATVQGWVFETGQAAAQSRKGMGYLKGEEYVMKVRAGESEGDVPYVVRGTMASGEVVDVVLAGTGQTVGGLRRQDVAVGKMIGIRAPSWNMEIRGKDYAVAVDWRVLQ